MALSECLGIPKQYIMGYMLTRHVYECRAAITTIGVLYERMGRIVGRSYEETVASLMKSLKNSEVII